MKTNELKCTDLRIGNWVKVNDPIFGVNAYKVATIRDNGIITLSDNISCSVNNIDPIELTEEVLLKIGFKKEERINSILYYLDYEINEDEYIRVKYLIYNSKTLPLLRITSPSANIYESHELTKRGVKYLHQLQNAYYCLTNQEMEVKL